jgi:TetR/AcrR family tetracycline transcriptional repressor
VTTQAVTAAGQRIPLSRPRILAAASQLIDDRGLDALSMHKLGAELGVKAMSLYNHVAGKDDVLDGVVELLWSEVEQAAPATPDWRDGVRSLAHAVRDVVHRHPNAAPMIISQPTIPASALRVVQAHVVAAVNHGLTNETAYALLRSITTYALGWSLAEVGLRGGPPGCSPAVSELLRPGVAEDLVEVAENFCVRHDPEAEFEFGLHLMLRGIESSLPRPSDTTSP